MKMGNQRRLLAVSEMPQAIRHDVDMRDISWTKATVEALQTLVMSNDSDVVRVVGPAPMGGDFIEIVLEEGRSAQRWSTSPAMSC